MVLVNFFWALISKEVSYRWAHMRRGGINGTSAQRQHSAVWEGNAALNDLRCCGWCEEDNKVIMGRLRIDIQLGEGVRRNERLRGGTWSRRRVEGWLAWVSIMPLTVAVIFCSHLEEWDFFTQLFVYLSFFCWEVAFICLSVLWVILSVFCIFLHVKSSVSCSFAALSVSKSVYVLSSTCLPYWQKTPIPPCGIHIHNMYTNTHPLLMHNTTTRNHHGGVICSSNCTFLISHKGSWLHWKEFSCDPLSCQNHCMTNYTKNHCVKAGMYDQVSDWTTSVLAGSG